MLFKKYLKKIPFLLAICLFTNSQAQTLSEEIAAIADIIVDINGSGDYTSVQRGLNAVPDSSDQKTIVFVKNGFYYEKIILKDSKLNVILVGENVDSTILSYDDHGDGSLPGHTFSSYSFRADAHDFQAYNITFDNPNTRSQAVAFHSNGDRQILYHCKLVSNQDTYFDNFRTRRYLKDCYIEGDVDFIFGFGVTLFDSCQIHCNDAGYITAAATPQYYEFGYVFKHCHVTTRDGGFWRASLGRPWFPYSNTIFFESYLSDRIAPGGWSVWSGREATCIYREYNNLGPGFKPESRVPWSAQLDPSLVPRYNIDTIFAASNFPSDLGAEVDSIELYSMRDRFEASGYAERADTILFAGRDFFPEYPTDNWSPEFYEPVYSIVANYTDLFIDGLERVSPTKEFLKENEGLEILNPVEDRLIIKSEKTINTEAILSIFDLSGKKVFEHQFQFIPEGFSELPLSYNRFETGIYIYHIEMKERQVGGKIFKN